MEITTIPTNELKQDLLDSQDDIAVCERALASGILTYSGGTVKYRLERNKYFVEVITAELKRRGVSDEVARHA